MQEVEFNNMQNVWIRGVEKTDTVFLNLDGNVDPKIVSIDGLNFKGNYSDQTPVPTDNRTRNFDVMKIQNFDNFAKMNLENFKVDGLDFFQAPM